eukprot:3523656-Rhodomonas_salina.2
MHHTFIGHGVLFLKKNLWLRASCASPGTDSAHQNTGRGARAEAPRILARRCSSPRSLSLPTCYPAPTQHLPGSFLPQNHALRLPHSILIARLTRACALAAAKSAARRSLGQEPEEPKPGQTLTLLCPCYQTPATFLCPYYAFLRPLPSYNPATPCPVPSYAPTMPYLVPSYAPVAPCPAVRQDNVAAGQTRQERQFEMHRSRGAK